MGRSAGRGSHGRFLSAVLTVGLVVAIIALYAFTDGTPGLLPTAVLVAALLIVLPWAVNTWHGGS